MAAGMSKKYEQLKKDLRQDGKSAAQAGREAYRRLANEQAKGGNG
jgi:hypothetical protein